MQLNPAHQSVKSCVRYICRASARLQIAGMIFQTRSSIYLLIAEGDLSRVEFEIVTVKVLNRHGCYKIWYIVYNLLISHPLQYKYLHFIEFLDEIIEEIYKIC